MIRNPVAIIPAPTEPVTVDLTAWAIGIGFPIALIWAAITLIACLFANGVL